MRAINTDAISNVEFADVDMKDYPDFSDAYVVSADMDDEPMTDEELEALNSEHGDWIYDCLMEQLY